LLKKFDTEVLHSMASRWKYWSNWNVNAVPENSTSVDNHQHSIFTRVIIRSSFTTVTTMANMENETEIVEGGWSKEGTGPLLDVMKGMPAVVLDTAVLTEHLLVKAVGASEELLLNLPTRCTSPVARRCFHAQVLEQTQVIVTLTHTIWTN
jgi:hypothetical protein